MLIILGFYKRKIGLSVNEFRYLWSEVYGPIYAKHEELRRHLRRYVQHRLAPTDADCTGHLPYDGFSEAWFENEEAATKLQEEKIYKEKVAPLAFQFLDLENSKLTAIDSQIYQLGAPPMTTSLQMN